MQNTLVAPVGILGFGVEGQSTFNYLVRTGIKEIVVMDKNPVNLPTVPEGVNVKTFSGEGYLDGLKDCVTVVRSAGVYPMSQELFKFQMNGGLMTSQIQLFLEQTKSKKTVGVIVPYRNQIAMVRKGIEKLGIPELEKISIDTVERYQGSQRDVIIYSFTIQNIWQLDFLAGNSFVEDGAIIDRKLNVAITRARKQMIMTGNPEILRNNQIFSELMNYVKEKGGYF